MPFAFFLQATVSMSRVELRWQLAGLAIGIVLLALGLSGAIVFALRRRSRDLSLLYLSLFSILYAIRLFFRESLVRAIFADKAAVWNWLDLAIDCVIVVPFTLFLIQIVEPKWRRPLRWLLGAQVAFGALRLLASLLHVAQHAMNLGNNVFVIATCALIGVYYVFSELDGSTSRELKLVFTGLVTFALFVVEGNLAELRILPAHRSVESIGYLIFILCLTYVAAHRTFLKEERLLALNKELQIANQIQSSILPREVPRLAGLEIAARYLPMSAVAGDFYDFLPVDARHVGVLVADVTGHGVPAALIASMLKVAFAAQGVQAHDPAKVLSGLNVALCGKFEDHFVTAAYVFVDLERFVIRYAGAGHPPPILSSRKGNDREKASRELEANGLMLGLFPEAAYTSLEIPLSAGDRILFYTDGISEAMNAAREEFGKSRLKKFLAATPPSASEAADSLLSELNRWSAGKTGRAQEDDITLVLLDFAAVP